MHGTLNRSDTIMRSTFFVGVYPGLTGQMIDYVIEVMTNIFQVSNIRREPAGAIR